MMKARIAYMYAKMKAEQLNKICDKRQFVLMTDNGKLVVMDKKLFYKLRKRGNIPKDITPSMLTRIALYYTSGANAIAKAPAMPDTTARHRKKRFLEYIDRLD